MKTTCPACGHRFETEKAKAAPYAALEAMYAKFLMAEDIAREYIQLFNPLSGKGMSLPKETRLVKELLAVWDAEYFETPKRGYQLTKEIIMEGLKATCASQPTLKADHRYLLKVLQAKATETQKRAEREKEEASRKRLRKPDAGPTAIKEVMTEADIEFGKQQAREILNRL